MAGISARNSTAVTVTLTEGKERNTMRDGILAAGAVFQPAPCCLSSGQETAFLVNLHTAPIPSLRGPNPQLWSILRPDKLPLRDCSACAHYMMPKADRGPVILETLAGTAHLSMITADMTSAGIRRLVRAVGASAWPPLVGLPNGIHSVSRIHAVKEDGATIVQEHAGQSKESGVLD
jgi:hypothetical protein